MKAIKHFLILAILCMFYMPSGVTQEVPKPLNYFGFEPGADHMLFNYEPLIAYLQELEKVSDRIELRKIGTSPMGKPIYIAFISSPENIARLDELKEINKRLALQGEISEEERAGLVGRAKVLAAWGTTVA